MAENTTKKATAKKTVAKKPVSKPAATKKPVAKKAPAKKVVAAPVVEKFPCGCDKGCACGGECACAKKKCTFGRFLKKLVLVLIIFALGLFLSWLATPCILCTVRQCKYMPTAQKSR